MATSREERSKRLEARIADLLARVPHDGLMQLHETYRRGDLIFTCDKGVLSKALLVGQTLADGKPARFAHVALCVAPGLLVESIPPTGEHPAGGVRIVRVEDDADCRFHVMPKRRFRALRLPKMDSDRVLGAIQYYLDQTYSYRFLVRPDHAGSVFCSQFAMQVLARAGVTPPGLPEGHLVTPSTLFRAAAKAGARDLSEDYRAIAERIEGEADLRAAMATDPMRTGGLRIFDASVALQRAIEGTHASAAMLTEFIDTRSKIQALQIDAELSKVRAASPRPKGGKPVADLWNEIEGLVPAIHSALTGAAVSRPAMIEWKAGGWRSELMEPTRLPDPARSLLNLDRLAAASLQMAEERREMLRESAILVAELAAAAATGRPDALPLIQAAVTRDFETLSPFFRSLGHLTGRLVSPWAERPPSYPPEIEPMARALETTLVRLEATTLETWEALCAWLAAHKGANAAIAARIEKERSK
ncbi:hypothetical protein [Plastoroseomonas arctica]|uniref:Permuted papain-like amidase enzyme, YaeF/YiiX, C92 family n=1 Tax=Plastoroseomonas arctica TaxID=1509237 RepID=A0AAF1JYN5_9PROT|nr:hypothetical protein [Plastoroseomonas arctica]MBR0656110.1 hypothetical protein [Plastoroseomonas arctica]